MLQRTMILVALLLYGCGEATVRHREGVPGSGAADSTAYASLRTDLERRYDLDQEIRKKVSVMDPYDQELVDEMMRTDSANQVAVLRILETHGWLPESRIGTKAADALFYVLQHGDVAHMEKYLGQLEELAARGEAKTTHAALMKDRIRMYRHEPQIYGTQASSRAGPDGSVAFYIWPVEDPATVNERRRAAGFDLTVEENAARLNAIYDPAGQLPEQR